MRGLAITAILVLAVGTGGCGRAVQGSGARPAPAVSRGRNVGATGLVVAHSARHVTFCGGAIATSDVVGLPNCVGIPVVGVNLSALSGRQSIHGAIWGSAYLAGVFSRGVLHVTEQAAPKPPGNGPHLIDPPCAVPVGGWASSPQINASTGAVAAYRRQFPSDITSLAVFRPRTKTWVLTIASSSPKRTMARLAPAYRGRLCVVRSQYALSRVRAATAAAHALLSRRFALFPVTGVGRIVGSDGQTVVEIEVLYPTAALRRALATQPAGLVKVASWLRPVSGCTP